MAEADNRKARSHAWLALLAIAALAASLRLYGMTATSLWGDEAWSLAIASSSSVDQFTDTLLKTLNPPLYYMLLAAWIHVLGSSDVVLRSLSVVLGVGAVLTTYAAGSILGGRRAGLLCAAVMAVMPPAVYFSQEARMYPLVCLLSAAVMYFLVRLIKRKDLPAMVGATLAGAALVYTHYYGAAFFLGCLAVASVSIVFREGRQAPWKELTAVLFGFGLLCAPWVPYVFTQLHRALGEVTHLAAHPGVFHLFASVTRTFAYVPGMSPHALLAMLTAGGALVVLYAAPLARNHAAPDEREVSRHSFWLIVGFASLPLLITWGVSQVVGVWTGSRVLSITAAPMALLLGSAVACAPHRLLTGALGAVIIAQCAYGNCYMRAHPHREQWREAAALIDRFDRPNDVIVVTTGRGKVLPGLLDRYYSGQCAIYGLDRNLLDPAAVREFLSDVWPRGERLWLVLSHEKNSPVLNVIQRPEAACHALMSVKLRGIQLFLFEQPSETACRACQPVWDTPTRAGRAACRSPLAGRREHRFCPVARRPRRGIPPIAPRRDRRRRCRM